MIRFDLPCLALIILSGIYGTMTLLAAALGVPA